MIVLLTNYLLVTSLSLGSLITCYTGLQLGHLRPRIPLSLHMVAISVFYSHTNISLIILMIATTLFWTGQFQRSLNLQRK